LAALLHARLPALAADVDARLQLDFIGPQGGLLKIVMHGGRLRAVLATKLHELSRQTVQQFLAGVTLAGTSGGELSHADNTLRSSLALATPALLEHGGTRRVLAILPRDSVGGPDAANVLQAGSTEFTTLDGADNSLTLCVEAGQLSLSHIALDFVQWRRDRVEFAQRVHCRTDISWTPLAPIPTDSAATTWTSAPNLLRKTKSNQEVCKTLVM
jgi:hypothetical protein